jgi:lon-related putative ATP-dependent protease
LLRRKPAELTFRTTEELEPLAEPLGQARALEALRFAMALDRPGYNVFAVGPGGVGRHRVVLEWLEQLAREQPTPDDWCYVYNFTRPREPIALRLPAGRGRELCSDVDRLVEELRTAIAAAFGSDEFRARAQEIQERFKEKSEKIFEEIAEEARRVDISMARTPSGVAFAPLVGGAVISPEAFRRLPVADQEAAKARLEALQERLQHGLRELPGWAKKARERLRRLTKDVAAAAAKDLVDEVIARYQGLDETCRYLEALRGDIIEHASELAEDDDMPPPLKELGNDRLRRFRVNLVVDHSETRGAPVVYEDEPSAARLAGHIEQRAQLGNLVSDFTQIKAGALQRANGGYLVVDALALLTLPFGWHVLKRALLAREARIEPLSHLLGLSATSAVDPVPIPLGVKVVLVADRRLYDRMSELDPDIPELFKITADFVDEVDASPEAELGLSRWLARLARDERLAPFDAGAVRRLIDHSARLAGDRRKLSVEQRSLRDLALEAAQVATQRHGEVVGADDVEEAISLSIRRRDLVRERTHEAILRDLVLIDTAGERVGVVNALAVRSFGRFAFGAPTRISATARFGKGEVVDIEREVELGGALHSKGVLILGHYFAQRYAHDFPLSLHGSVAFEQSYGGVEGDSASLAELCALLSALARAPIRQSVAVTGSINQLGEVQPIGGVNEKVEGFFDICAARGLEGQGVIVPVANIPHLMLRADVCAAVDAGKFHVWTVSNVDEAIEILTGVAAGTADDAGVLPPESVNGRVLARLRAFAAAAAELAGHKEKENAEHP